ncbi:MAG: AbrB/MazE/SpoVT family DNA-binding domain-containing protein [Bacteroidales bacterium]
MEIPVVKIGNSKGLRLSKTLLEKYNIKDRVELVLEDEQIIIRPVNHPRMGWEDAFVEMHAQGDDQLLMDDVFNDENPEEWS